MYAGYADEIVVDELVRLRHQLKPYAEEQGVKLSFLPFIIKVGGLLHSAVVFAVLRQMFDTSSRLGSWFL